MVRSFSADLPISHDKVRPNIIENRPEEAKPTILVIDENVHVRALITEALKLQFRVKEAICGKEGIDKARAIIPDLVISNVMMPVVNGFELCTFIKLSSKTSHIPVILLSEEASEAHIVQGLEIGADAYFTKPFSVSLLVARVKNLIRLRRQLRFKFQLDMLLQPGEISVSSKDAEFINEIQAIIEENISEPEFSVDQMARKLYMSQSTLYRKVQALTGESPQIFIRNYRLKRAAQLIKSGFGNITQVAFAVGFSSTPYFTKCFKRKFNRLPSGYQVFNAK